MVGRATTHEWGRPSLRAQHGAGRPHECVVTRPTTAPDAKTWSISILHHTNYFPSFSHYHGVKITAFPWRNNNVTSLTTTTTRPAIIWYNIYWFLWFVLFCVFWPLQKLMITYSLTVPLLFLYDLGTRKREKIPILRNICSHHSNTSFLTLLSCINSPIIAILFSQHKVGCTEMWPRRISMG